MKVFTAALARPRARRGASPHSRIAVIIGSFLAIDGLAVVGLWMLSLSSGAFGGITGLLVYQDGNLSFHVTAELLMGLLAVASGIGLMGSARRAAGTRAVRAWDACLFFRSIRQAGRSKTIPACWCR